jgi:hypothetical protein
MLPSIVLVQDIAAKWLQPLPRAQSVKRLITINVAYTFSVSVTKLP